MEVLKEIISWITHIVAAILCALLIIIFVFQPTNVEGSSMESTLHNNDKVYVNKLVHTFRLEFDYKDIVIIDSRVDKPHTLKDDLIDSVRFNAIANLFHRNTEEIYWIKRVICKPGDELEFKDGKVIRNGELLDETYIKEQMRGVADRKITVPKNHVFVMGDNRNNSKDSRIIGSIPLDHVIGKFAFKF